MLKFTDTRLYVKGVGEAYLRDPSTGDITYYSDKFSEGQITPSQDEGEIAAGLGNGLAAMIPTNSRVQVSFTAADFDLRAKSMSVGASLGYGAPVMVCQTVVASGASLAIDTANGTPVANVGMSKTICYVQEVGAASPVEHDGVAYEIDPTSGAVSDFSATAGKTYKVWYFVSRANAQMATLTSNMNGKVQHFTATFAIYSNVNTETRAGTRWGTLYVVVPSLKLTAAGSAIDGNQTSNTTTGIIGQALMYDEETVSANCDNCAEVAAPMAYYIVVPCDTQSGIEGLALIGGIISVPQGGSVQPNFKLVVNGNNLVPVDQAFMSYEMTTAITGVSVSATGLVTASDTAIGDGELTATYSNGGQTFSIPVNVTVEV